MNKRKLEAKNKDSIGYKLLKSVVKLFIKKPDFIFLGEKIDKPTVILTNHVGAKAPLTLELYAPFKKRLLGTYEMNGSVKEIYIYLSRTYYYQKKKWNRHVAKIFSFIAAPIVHAFYRGLKLISSYNDYRFLTTIKESYRALSEFQENLIIFPEDSSQGYFDHIQKFYSGFLLICDYIYKHGIDVDIMVAYLNYKRRTYVFDKAIKYSDLLKMNKTRDELTEMMLNRCNELGAQYSID